MALVSPINPAFPNDLLMSNIVGSGFGNLTDLDVNENIYDVHALRCARSLILVLDQPIKKRIQVISFAFHAIRFDASTTEGNKRLGARVLVCRNYKGNINQDIIDPFFTAQTPNLKRAGSTGIDWQVQSRTLCDWSQQDIVWNRWIHQETEDSEQCKLSFEANDKVAVIITPVYFDGLQLATGNATAPDFEDPTNVGVYAGSFGSGFLDSRNRRVLRSLNVQGCYE